MAVTTTSNVIIPEVLAAMIAAEIPGQLALAGSDAVTVLDNLKGGPGNTIKIPRWGTIGDFTEVAEGIAMPIVNIAASAVPATVKKFARGVEVTDEALLASYDDPLKEVARQFARYAARAADRELITAAETSTLQHEASGTITLNDIVDAIGKWNDASVDISGLVVHSKVYRDLIKLNEFKTLTSKSDQVIERGVVGMLYGVPIRVSDALTVVPAVPADPGPAAPQEYRNLLLKKNALGLWYQRNMNVETERDTIKRTTVITADTIFAAAMFQSNPLPVVKLVTQ
jgi:N4-gp56 family major capsid protein